MTPDERQAPATATVSELRGGEENEGPLESTDLFVEGRCISLLVNVEAGGRATYSLTADGQDVSHGWICKGAERQALEALIAKLDEVHAHPQYKAVWMLAHIHGQNYTGPTYDKELEAAREALGRLPREEQK